MTIQMYEWHTRELLTVEVVGEPILVDDYDGENMWFEVDIRFENGNEHYAEYDEANLRWQSGQV